MPETEANKYLSLRAVAQLYGYTRDHFGLMIRQGKLKGIKLGSYYVTTNEWVTEYIKKYADFNHPKIKNKLSNRFLSEVLLSDEKIKSNNLSDKFTKFIKFTKNVPQKPTDSPVEKSKNDLQNDLQKEILDAFSNLGNMANATNVETAKKYIAKNPDNEFSLPFEPPYLILPIRKMEENEKERILKLLEQNTNKTDLA